MKEMAEGKVDIIIGTHKLLSAELTFKDLGLLIVDEEHRFGVRQKEKIKALRADVDILTLTATPIPRTLNMAMSGMRDLSIIATLPPSGSPSRPSCASTNLRWCARRYCGN
jgi:transcription-repair coupling factor (superfamily II helicase)